MQLKEYSKFLQAFPPEKQHIFHLGVITEKFFYLAEHQISEFQKELKIVFDRSKKLTESSDKLYSFALGFYPLVKVSLDASYRLNCYFEETEHSLILQEYRKSESDEITGIRNIANDIVKHPLDDESRGKRYFIEPATGSDSAGGVAVNKWWLDETKHGEVIRIKPKKDLETVFYYLETLATIYQRLILISA